MTISYGSASSVRRATREELLQTEFVRVCPYLVVPPDLVYVRYDARWHAVVALLTKPQAARRAADEEAGKPKTMSAKIYVSPGSATRQVQSETTSI